MTMRVAMMWFENDPKKTTNQIIDEAVKYYEKKYEKKANCCIVNPKTITEEFQHGEIKVKISKSILPLHYWIGRDQG